MGSADAWLSLAGEYSGAADDLARALAESSAVWEGAGAEAFRAAHAPILAWLADQAADATVAAGQHIGVAAAYDAALAAMPTLAELAAHTALLGVNFMGINTIAINEADYARMWVQAASVMESYQAADQTLVANTPHSLPSPRVLNGGTTRLLSAKDPAQPSDLDLLKLLQRSLGDLLHSIGLDRADLLKVLERAVESGLSVLALLPQLAVGAYLVVSQGYWLVWAMIFASPIFIPLLIVALQQSLGSSLNTDEAIGEAVPETDQPPGHCGALLTERPQLALGVALASPAPSASAASSAPPCAGEPPPLHGWRRRGREIRAADHHWLLVVSELCEAASSATASQSSKDSASREQGAVSRARGRAKGRRVKLEEDQQMRADAHMNLHDGQEPVSTASREGGGPLGVSGASLPEIPTSSGFQKFPGGPFQTGPIAPMLPSSWSQQDR